MKNFILAMLMGIMLANISSAEDGLYPLDIQIRVYPEKIHYGDVCFLLFSVTNNGPETLLLPYGNAFLRTRGVLYREQKGYDIFDGSKIFFHFSGIACYEESLDYSVTIYSYSGRPVKPGETMVFHIRPVWIPTPEFSDRDNAVELRKTLERRDTLFQLRSNINYHKAYASTYHPRLDAKGQLLNEDDLEGLTARQLAIKHPEYPDEANSRDSIKTLECNIQILPRIPDTRSPRREVPGPKDVLLIQEWFLELPSTLSIIDGVFAHPYRVRNSPFKMPNATPLELDRKREPLFEVYQAFYKSMETRTPESLARIKRTNAMASQIIERSKQPGSTISQNMVEFIQLRGFLVDMRYAENEQAEQAAFEKLMDFVGTAKDKELWIRFLDEIGLYSIMHQTHFPSRKVEHYRELFTKRFAKLQEQEKSK